MRSMYRGRMKGAPAELPDRYAAQRDELVDLRMENLRLREQIGRLMLDAGKHPAEIMEAVAPDAPKRGKRCAACGQTMPHVCPASNCSACGKRSPEPCDRPGCGNFRTHTVPTEGA